MYNIFWSTFIVTYSEVGKNGFFFFCFPTFLLLVNFKIKLHLVGETDGGLWGFISILFIAKYSLIV